MNQRYRSHLMRRYRDFISLVAKQPGNRFAEFGCGAGNITKLLIEEFGSRAQHVCLDLDADMLELAKRNLPYRNVDFVHGNICEPTSLKFDVVHSHGVLEHLDDEAIRTTIQHQKAAAQTLIHYVPSWKYVVPSYGDERLMTPEEWQRICQPSHIEELNDGFDLVLVWKNDK